MAVQNGVAIPGGTRGYLQAGTDGTNARFLATDANGLLYSNDLAQAIARGRVTGLVGAISGEVTTNSGGTRAAILATTFVDQTANAQRSVRSSSANDTAAGTGARTIRITYYSIAAGVVTGPFTETVTLNGTATVNTVSTTIAFIERVEVLTVGTGGFLAGTLSIFGATGGGGGTIATVAASNNVSRWAHHWVASGRRCMIYDVFMHNTAASGNFPRVTIESLDVSVATAASIPFSTMRVDGRSSVTPGRESPLVVTGPARIRAFVVPENNPIQITTFEARYIEI